VVERASRLRDRRRVSAASQLFSSPRLRTAILFAATAVVLIRLGATDLLAPDEPRYALVAEELRSGAQGWRGLVLLHLHGDPYTQKPPLFFWLAALAGTPGGRVDEIAARFPSALAGVATVAATMAIGTRLFGYGTGTLAGLLLVTTIDWSYRARTAQLDTLLALFETLAILAFWRIESTRAAGATARRCDIASLHAALGLAVLTKGPVGFAVPLLAIAGWLAWERRLRDFATLFPPWAFALSIGPGLAWIAGAVALAPPGFFDVAIVDNLFGRAVQGTAHARPFWFYLEKFPVDLLPWLLLLPVTIAVGGRAVRDPEDGRGWRFLVAWIATSFLLFSAMSGKRVRYLLPIEPAFALLFATTLARTLGARGARCIAVAAVVVWLGQLFVFGALLPAYDARHSARPLAEAVARVAGHDAPVGLYRAADVATSVAYYGIPNVQVFRGQEQLGTFLAAGGRVLVFEAKRLGDVEQHAAVEVRERVPIDDHEWIVARVRRKEADS
jgi:4-amino-4-deoxy-L-arabinose transferase-like glycosyltransferase